MPYTDDGFIHETFDKSRVQVYLDITGIPEYEVIVQCWQALRKRWARAVGDPSVVWQLRTAPLLHQEIFSGCDGIIIEGVRVPIVSDHHVLAYTTGENGEQITSDIWIELVDRDDGGAGGEHGET